MTITTMTEIEYLILRSIDFITLFFFLSFILVSIDKIKKNTDHVSKHLEIREKHSLLGLWECISYL